MSDNANTPPADDVREALAKRIIARVEEIASKGIAGDAVRQVPKGYDYGKHWPIMVAIEMMTDNRPVTKAAVEAAYQALRHNWRITREDARAALEAAREVQP